MITAIIYQCQTQEETIRKDTHVPVQRTTKIVLLRLLLFIYELVFIILFIYIDI